jgi:hypothetical protein
MTRLEILQTEYSATRVRDTWVALGSLQATNTTRFFTKDSLYLVQEAGSALNNFLLYCKEDSAGVITWETGTLEDYDYGEISFQQGIIDPRFVVLLTNEEYTAIVDPIDTTWVPFQDVVQDLGSVTIPDSELNIILSDIGVPFISFDELEYPKKDILDVMIKPALEEYFKWFPKVHIQTYPITTGNEMILDMPEGAYEAIHIAVNQGLAGSGASSNPLLRYFDEVVWAAGSPSMGGGFGGGKPRTSMRDWGGMMMDRAGRQAVINYATRIRHNTFIDQDGKRKLRVISNKMGVLEVQYALRTLDWNDVEFARQPELRELCRANVLRAFGSLRGQSKTDIIGVKDYEGWIQKAENIRKEVLVDWKSLVKYSGILRGSG